MSDPQFNQPVDVGGNYTLVHYKNLPDRGLGQIVRILDLHLPADEDDHPIRAVLRMQQANPQLVYVVTWLDSVLLLRPLADPLMYFPVFERMLSWVEVQSQDLRAMQSDPKWRGMFQEFVRHIPKMLGVPDPDGLAAKLLGTEG